MNSFLFKARDGQTPLPADLRKDLIPKTVQLMGELDEYEEENIAEGLIWLEKYTGEDYLTSTFWLKLHKHLFANVWKWAGKVRTYELANTSFVSPLQIWTAFKNLEDNLKYWLEHRPFSNEEIAARFHERIETIHPFPNGNGRFGRIMTEYLCQRRSFPIPTWGVSLKAQPQIRRTTYINALDSARETHNYDSLVKVMYS